MNKICVRCGMEYPNHKMSCKIPVKKWRLPTAETLLESYRFKAGEHIGNSDYDLMCKFAIEFAKHNRVLYVNYPLDRISIKREANNPLIAKRIDAKKFRLSIYRK
jgi:hypothetical protein